MSIKKNKVPLTKNINVNKLLGRSLSISEKFHKNTKLSLSFVDLPEEDWPESWKKVQYKGYARLDEISLPKPATLSKVPFGTTLRKRRSTRDFSDKKVDLKQISTLLYHSASRYIAGESFHRPYPSGGARYPLEIYLLSSNTELDRGLYHYYVKSHSLESLVSLKEVPFKKYFNQDWIDKASCVLIITGVFNRTTVKYGDRGYKLALIEAGHLGQNICLTATALGMASCPAFGFYDDQINKLLDIDGTKEAAIITIALGDKSSPKTTT